MHSVYYKLAIVFGFFLLSASMSVAQQQNQNTGQNSSQNQDQDNEPIPAYRSPLASAGDNSELNSSPDQMAPDTTSLAGAEQLSVGSPEGQRSYWQPHIGINVTANSDGVTSSQGSSWTTWASIYGGIDLHKFSGRSALTLSYVGGGVLSNDNNTSNGVTQGLSVSEKYNFRRETISLLENLNYLPGASAGLGIAGGLGTISLPGINNLGLNYPYLPGQTILSTTGQDLSNSSVVESDTILSARSSISLTGGYVTQRYFDNDLLDSYGYDFQGGYNYQISPKNTLALSYTFSAFRYSNFDQSIDNHVIQISYSRHITGRLVFQIGGGPEISISNFPITQNSILPTTGSSTSELFWTLNTALHYQVEGTGLSAVYYHGVTAGAGALAGSQTDSASGTITHRLTRTTTGNFNVGYARNNGVSIVPPITLNQTYDYWYGGAGVSRPFGRTMNVTLSYQFQYQNSDLSFCAGPSCGTSYTRHLITIGFDWHDRPRAF
jgi:hypothetical protein